ncbi:hypothetical protein FHR32_006626 [Streptosporangium album]|uniref:Abortive phage infection protein C-terminal domain-containing protein n=1 Tax=Streptosporangium album TaxID=47479 RepID=A0A7W7WDC1_9ACTN|nr:AIPR family protein [Streptosporangium album]MBB4942240.1 hypothetical protein [Streptosporangium album]
MNPNEGPPLSILHINQLAAHIRRTLIPHLDLSDLRVPVDGNPASLSRGLAALGVQALTGFDAATAAACVIDGFDDNGIDAVAIDDNHDRIFLVQAKWHAEGRKNVDQAEALKLTSGARDLFAGRYDRFNQRLRALQPRIEAALNNPRVKITLAIVTTGSDQLAEVVRRPLDNLCDEVNDAGELVDVNVLGLKAIHDFVVNGTSGRGVDLDVHLTGWGSIHTPYEAFYGVATAVQVAGWYEDHGERLFDGNLRDALGQTPVNDALFATLWNEPEHFWYFNNGITVLAEEVHRAARDSQTREYGKFQIVGATVVNGAQTAASVRSILRKDPDLLSEAKIWIRIISLDGCPEGFAARVTRATNTQNGVDARDFIALDPRQERIRAQFRLQFDKVYGVRRGSDNVTGDDGCDVEEAAVALACANADPAFAVDAKRQVSLLWTASDDATYQTLFPNDLNVVYLWNSVLVLRAVERKLADLRSELDGRDGAVAVHGNRLIAHMVLSQLDDRDLNDPEAERREAFASVPELTRTVCLLLAVQVQKSNSGVFLGSLFKNHVKCRELVECTLESFTGSPVQLPLVRVAAPRSTSSSRPAKPDGARKADAVKVIQNAGLLSDGAQLIFKAVTQREKSVLLPWIAQDPRRGRAMWSNHGWEALVWEADGQRYAASRLVMHMMREAGFPNPPSGVRGPMRWMVPDHGTLNEIADKLISGE